MIRIGDILTWHVRKEHHLLQVNRNDGILPLTVYTSLHLFFIEAVLLSSVLCILFMSFLLGTVENNTVLTFHETYNA